jgi:hypothetical protein
MRQIWGRAGGLGYHIHFAIIRRRAFWQIGNSAFFSSGVFCVGVLGDIAGGVISDEILPRTGSVVAEKQNVIAIGLLGGLAFLAPLLFSHNLMTITACLAGASFFSELTIGPI